MNGFALFGLRVKTLFADVSSLLILILCTSVALFADRYAAEQQAGRLTMAYVNEDSGALGERLFQMLSSEDDITVIAAEKEKAVSLLQRGDIQCMVRIPQDFTARIERGEYNDAAELTASATSQYTGTVSEPLVNHVMKLWFEHEVRESADEFLAVRGLKFTDEQRERITEEMQAVWMRGAAVQVVKITPKGAPSTEKSVVSSTALGWYAAWLPFYLIVCNLWMLRSGSRELVGRIHRSGFGASKLFLNQSLACLLPAALGFVLTALLGGEGTKLLRILPHFLLYAIGCIGAALLLCSLGLHLSVLLMVAPVMTVAAALLSELLFALPDWAAVYVSISYLLPERYFREALIGSRQAYLALPCAMIWLIIGVFCAYRMKTPDQRAASKFRTGEFRKTKR